MTWLAPCGCPGEPIIGTYVACRVHDSPNACPRCGSKQTEPFVGFNVPPGSRRCEPCGKVWWRP